MKQNEFPSYSQQFTFFCSKYTSSVSAQNCGTRTADGTVQKSTDCVMAQVTRLMTLNTEVSLYCQAIPCEM